ncbi:hypothetical protein ABTF26_21405, partial [Acinetobacter baumannii]
LKVGIQEHTSILKSINGQIHGAKDLAEIDAVLPIVQRFESLINDRSITPTQQYANWLRIMLKRMNTVATRLSAEGGDKAL